MAERRPATLRDAEQVADVETARTPDSPIAGVMVAYDWTHPNDGQRTMRWVAAGNGDIDEFVEAGHDAWLDDGERRYGWVHVSIHPESWTASRYHEAIAVGESWLRAEAAEVSVTTLREDFARELEVLTELGYREERRERYWELDLVARRDDLLATSETARADMQRQGVELTTLDQDSDPETLRQVYALDIAATRDIPTTVPIRMSSFDTWYGQYFESPGVRKETFWIAKMGAEVVGMSLIDFPPERGVPSTWFTGVSSKHRGRGIARALKYATVAQAIALGATRIRTDNDSTNAPILHINEEMGYLPIKAEIELHRTL